MRYRTLGNSGCAVSELCLGTMTFGAETDEKGAHAQLDRFVEAGGNFVDTADVYSSGASEEIIGRWFATVLGEVTDSVVLATKGRFATGAHPNDNGTSTRHLSRALDASLERLGVEAVDLYQVHAWDPWTPLEETLRTLDGFVRAGKIRYYGLLQLHRLAADQGRAHRAGPGPGRAGDPAAAVQPDRPRDRVGDRPGRARRGLGHAAVEPPGRRLADRQVPARPASCRPDPAGRGPGARHGGLGPSRHRADLADHRGGAAGRRGTRRVDGPGRAGLGHQPPRR